MVQHNAEDAVRHTVTVETSKEHAFSVFTDGLAGWWPSEYTWAQDTLEAMIIEPWENGRCTEQGPHNFECDWGRVLAWEPPHRLVMSWQISPKRVPEPDPAKTSEVEVQFVTEGPTSTRVRFEHRNFEQHGEGAEGYREAMGSEYGWPYILDRYASAVS
jgi:uncharacterized protein YndB with AHSA1/START domain